MAAIGLYLTLIVQCESIRLTNIYGILDGESEACAVDEETDGPPQGNQYSNILHTIVYCIIYNILFVN